MTELNFREIELGDALKIKHMQGLAVAAEDYPEQEKEIRVLFKSGPWSGKEFSFTKDQIK